MNRDGAKESIWQSGINDYTSVNQWKKSDVYDVLVVGGGITGLTTALLLQKSGKKCILAEGHTLGFGTTGGTTSHINTLLDTSYSQIIKNFGLEEAKLVATGTREAIDLIEGLVNVHNINCGFQYETGYLFAETEEEEQQLNDIAEASKKAGVLTNETKTLPIKAEHRKVYRFDFQARFHPTQYILGLAKTFEQEGGVILQQCMVHKIETGDHLIADTSLGEIHCSRAVYATHIPPGLNILHMRCAPYRSYAAAIKLNDNAYPDGLVYDMKDPYNYYRTHGGNGDKYLIAGGFDHKTGHDTNTEQVFREMEAHLHKLFNFDTMEYSWSSQYYIPADGLPYIGLLPGHDYIYTGTGYSGNGITLGSLAAKIICELITNKESKYEKLFNPSRIKPIAGFTEFVKENADVVSMFINRRLSYDKIASLAELAPGEATVAKWEGHKVAIYKDENGKIHAVDPVCPHAKCVVLWNNAEKSWDCPCHGGRYAPDGTLLTGPAQHGLTPLIWQDFEGD